MSIRLLGERIAFTLSNTVDPDGAVLRHRARNLLTVAVFFEERGGTHEDLIRLANEAAHLNEAVVEYCAVHGLRYASASTPMPSALEAMREAVQGPPSAETLVECPGCSDCTLCHGSHLVSPRIAIEWRRRNGG